MQGTNVIARKIVEDEIQAQRLIISQFKREIFGVDKTSKSQYIKEFVAEYTTYRRICSAGSVIEEAAGRDIVFFGDYHPLDASQRFVLRLMKGLAVGGRKVVLALEMLYIRQQEFLDLWMKGKIDEERFLEAIDYDSEWGFKWKSYRRIFKRAKDPFIPIFGIDVEPRDNLKYIRMRDRMMARRIRNIRKFFPGCLVLVVVGESHLASGHLPYEIRKTCTDGYRDMIIVQNIDDIYWKLLRKGRETAEAVRIDGNRYCVFTASPMLKYLSYREIIDFWIEGEGTGDHITVFQEMISNIRTVLLGGKTELEVTMRGGWRGGIEEAFPEILVRKTYNAFSSYLRIRRVPNDAHMSALFRLRRDGIAYVAAINAFLVLKFDPVGAAQEAARFIVHVLRDDIVDDGGRKRSREDRFYLAVFEEALVCLGSKIIGYARDCVTHDSLLGTIDSRGVVRMSAQGFSLRETRRMVRMLKYLFRRDRSGKGGLRSTPTMNKLFAMRSRMRLVIIDTLGFTLGEAIHRSYRDGLVSHGEIVSLLGERFIGAGRARKLYNEWVARVKPFRGDWKRR